MSQADVDRKRLQDLWRLAGESARRCGRKCEPNPAWDDEHQAVWTDGWKSEDRARQAQRR